VSRFFKVRLVTQAGERIEVGVAANDGMTAMDRAWIDYREAHPDVRLAGGATLCTITKAEYDEILIGAAA